MSGDRLRFTLVRASIVLLTTAIVGVITIGAWSGGGWEANEYDKEMAHSRALELTQQVQQIEQQIYAKYGRHSFNPDEYSLLGATNWDPDLIYGWDSETSKLDDVYRLEMHYEIPVDGGYLDYYCVLEKAVESTFTECTYEGETAD